MEESLSREGNLLCAKMLEELAFCGYGYVSIIEGCYDYCIKGYCMEVPVEGKTVIVNKVLEILKTVDIY